jgi:hypothetical protein
MAIPQPLILTDASLKLGETPTDAYAALKELACVASHVELTPDVSVTTVDTMCGSKDYPGVVKWALIATFVQSFDALATEEVLSAALAASKAANGAPIPFALAGYKGPVSATNPCWTGKVIPQPYSPINGDAGDASEVEIEWSLDAPPLKNTTTPTVFGEEPEAEAASGGGSGSSSSSSK